MLKNKIYLSIFIFFCVLIISFSATGESLDSNFITEGHPVINKHSKIESNLLDNDQGMGKQSALMAQFHDQNTKKVVFELNGNDTSYLKSLKESGASIEAVHNNLVQASVPVSQLQMMSELPFVNYVRSPRRPFLHTLSEGVGVINATPLNNLGIRGQGVKIAVLDVGFAGYQSKLGSELPSNVNVRSFWNGGNIESGGNHGTAVAEIIYDIAPDAELYLINFGTDLEFLDAVDYTKSENVDIISMSLGWLEGPFDGTSTMSSKVNIMVSSGIIWINSAGNYAQKHWEGKFSDADPDGIHNTINVPSEGKVSLFLRWDDRNQDYELCIYEASNNGLFLCSNNMQDGTQEPAEKLIEENIPGGSYNIKIEEFKAKKDVNFQLYSAYQDLKYQVPSRSLSVPGDAAGAITVGATDYSNDMLEIFSSQGPTIDGRKKPDVVAPDRVSNSIISPFYGTSASAPHVAGAAALLKNINPSLTPDELRSALESTAKDLGDKGKDNLYGSGKIDAWNAALLVDKKTPSISIVFPKDGTILNISPIIVNGTASDNDLSKVEVKVGSGAYQIASGTSSWNANVTLATGLNTISARATDIADHYNETSITVTLDMEHPVVSITSPANDRIFSTSSITVNGTASDNDGLGKVEVRVGNGGWITAQGTILWNASITLSKGSNTIYARATDIAGNYDENSITVTLDTTPPSITINEDAEFTNSSVVTLNLSSTMRLMKFSNDNTNWTDWEPFTSSRSWTLTKGDGVKTVFFSVSDDAINDPNRGAFDNIKLDTTPPAVSDLSVTPTMQELNHPVEIKAKIIDNLLLNTSSLSVLIEPQNGNTIKCPMVRIGNEIYSCYFDNTTFYGRYNVKIIAFDLADNTNNTVKTWFVTTMEPYNNISVRTEKNIVTEINALTKVNTTLEFVTSQNANGNIKITMSNDIPPEINQPINHIPLKKFISISANPAIEYNLQWMNIKLFYTDNELSASGLDENSLRVIYYNESLQMWETLSNTDVNTANTNNYSGFVWANVSHLSTFALVGSYPLPSNPPRSSSSGGGGGGGGGTSGEDFTNIIVKEKYDMHIYKDKVTSYKFTNLSNPILSINIMGNVNAGEIGTSVEVLRNTSSLVKTPAPGNVYKNVNMWVGTSGFGTSKNIKQAVITFRVENSWISSNNIKSNSIKMVRWDGSKWNQLETSEKTKDSTYIYFEAKTDSFSSFAITGIEKKESITENADIIEPTKPAATIQSGGKTSDFLTNWFLIIGVFFAIGLIIEIYLRMKKK